MIRCLVVGIAAAYAAAAGATDASKHVGGAGATACGRYYAVAFPPPAGRDGALVFVVEVQADGPVIVGLQLGTTELGAQQGGWSNTSQPGTSFPQRMWFVPWRAR